MMHLYRPKLTELERLSKQDKSGAPWKHDTRRLDESHAHSDVRLEERFFQGNTFSAMKPERIADQKTAQKEGKTPQSNLYQPDFAERERKRQPYAFARFGNDFGRMELSADRQQEHLTLTVAQKTDADKKTLPNSAKRLDARRATPVRGMTGERGKVLTSLNDPRQSALAFKTKQQRGYRDAVTLMEQIKNRGGSETIEETMPFLSAREEIAQEELLSKEIQQTTDSAHRTGLIVRRNHISRVRRQKEARRGQFIRQLNVALQKQKKAPSSKDDLLLRQLLRRIEEGSEGNEEGEDDGA